MKHIGLWMWGISAFVATAVYQAPATLLDWGIRQASDGLLRIADARGSVWNGSGVLLANAPSSQSAPPLGSLAWNLLGFKNGSLKIGLDFDNRPLGAIRADLGGISSSLTDWRLPAAETLRLLPGALGRAEWEGRLAMTTGEIRCDWLGRCAGQVQLAWTGAATQRIENGTLGDYFLAVDGRNEQLNFKLSSGEGPIRLEGTGQVLDQHMKFNGLAHGNDSVLSQFPGFLGKVFEATENPGEYRITVDSQLAMP